MRLHFLVGIAAAPFLLVAALTGLAYTATPAVEHVVYAHELRVDVPPGAQRLPLGEQVAAARAAHPEGVVTGVRVPEEADGSTRVVLAVDDVAPDRARTVFVDPYTGAVLGQLTTFGEWLPVRAWVDDLHRNLHLGEVGRVYSELAASWLWVLVGGGLVLWARRRVRAARGRGRWRASRDALLPDLSVSRPRARTLSWHGVVGTWAALGLLGLSVTGLTWSHFAGANVARALGALSWSTPSLTTELHGGATGAGAMADMPGMEGVGDGARAGHGDAGGGPDAVLGEGVGLDGVLAAAREHAITSPLQITPPARAGTAWTVAETDRVWPVHQDSVAVDPSDGRVVDALRFDDYPVGAKLTEWGVDAHMGILLGPANMVALAALALALVVLIVWGYRMWWLRRPAATWRSVGPAPRRVAWRQVPWSWRVLGAAAAALVALAMPVLGASLLVLLALDVAVGWVRRSRRRGRS